VQQRPEDLSGDYEYDLAHERTGDRTAAPDVRTEHPGPAPAHRPLEPGQDMGYDLAHDF
jgi:hypothetical protein